MRKLVLSFALGAVFCATVFVAVNAGADIKPKNKSEHWGVITRNTIGSPVAELRDGPFGSFGHTGPAAEPPFGKGSLGIAVADDSTTQSPPSEKAAFGNEVAYLGEPVLDLTAVGFQVFQTGENVGYGGPRNLPNITFEIDANLTALPADNYTSMVWVPDAVPVASINEWSGYLDATTTGNWYFTGAEGVATTCTQALTCNFTQAMTALNDGGDAPIFYTVQVTKGRDNMWIGAVDGLRLNKRIYDFEADGVKERGA